MKRIISSELKDGTFLRKNLETVSKEGLSTYGKYYHLYEYTDDICVLEDNPLYPGLINYVKTGLLTKEELIDALEYDKGFN